MDRTHAVVLFVDIRHMTEWMTGIATSDVLEAFLQTFYALLHTHFPQASFKALGDGALLVAPQPSPPHRSAIEQLFHDLLTRSAAVARGVVAWCERGERTSKVRFAVWAWVAHILHVSDNQDGGEPPWKQVRVRETGRTMFQEDVAAPRLVWMGVGRARAWFNPFWEAANRYGTLTTCFYELSRVGSGMQDTDYSLRVLAERAVPPEVLISLDMLPTVETVFKDTLLSVPTLRGSVPDSDDALEVLDDGWGVEGLTGIEPEEVE